MLTFTYKAVSPDGSVVAGTRTAVDRMAVAAQLHAQGHFPIRIDDAVPARPHIGQRWTSWRRQRIRQEQIGDFTRSLATLLRAGVPLDRALLILRNLEADSRLGRHLEDIQARVKAGSSLADALSAQQDVFSRLYVSLVRAGESSGALEAVLDRLVDHLEASKEIRDSMTSALIYPMVLVVVAIGAVLILLAYVVPQFTEMFESAGKSLPLSTRITIATGEAVKAYAWLVLPLGGAVLLGVRRWLAVPANRLRWHGGLLGIPIAGDIYLKAEVARFARTLGTLLTNGVTLLKALTIAGDTLGNRALAQGIDRVENCIREGRSLAESLERQTVFPEFAIHMIRVGEESGNLDEILGQVATAYERDTRTTIKRAMTLLEPVLILGLGGVIAAVIISILSAVLSINELVI